MNKQEEFIAYVEKRYPGLKINQQTIGVILQAGMYIALGNLNDAEIIVIAEMNSPKKAMTIPIESTTSYWAARNLLWRFPNSIKYALTEAENHGVYRKSLLKKEEKDEN